MTKTRVELFFLLILSKLNDKWVLLNSRKLTWTWWILVNKPDCFQIQPTRLRFRNPIALHIPFKSRVYVRKVLLHSSGIEFPVWINRSNLHSHFVTARVWIKAIFILPLGLTLCFPLHEKRVDIDKRERFIVPWEGRDVLLDLTRKGLGDESLDLKLLKRTFRSVIPKVSKSSSP